jgi:hypothetical protein
MRPWLPLLLITCGQGAAAADRGLRDTDPQQRDKEFNLTTISPDDETIDTLIDAVDSAVGTLQSAIDYSEYPVEPGSSGQEQQDYKQEDYNGDYNGDYDYKFEEEEDYTAGVPDRPGGNNDYGGGDDEYGDGDVEYGDGDDEYEDYEYEDGAEEYEDAAYEYEDGDEEDDDAIVIEEATAGALVLNSTVRFSYIYSFMPKARCWYTSP